MPGLTSLSDSRHGLTIIQRTGSLCVIRCSKGLHSRRGSSHGNKGEQVTEDFHVTTIPQRGRQARIDKTERNIEGTDAGKLRGFREDD